MFKEHISDENMINMAAAVARSMDPETYEKGRGYYKSGLVQWVKLFGPRAYSVVDDGKKYTVIIHIDNFANSACSCARKHFCEHIAAVFLHYYEPWMKANKRLSNKDLAAGKKAFRKSPPFQLAEQVSEMPVMDGPVEGWYQYFERAYDRIKGSATRHFQLNAQYRMGEPPYLAAQFNDFIARVSAHSNGWPSFNKDLFRFHCILFFMDALEKQTEDVSVSQADIYQVGIIENNFRQALSAVLSHKQRGKHWPFFQKALELVRANFLRKKTLLFAWIYAYRLMCVTLLGGADWLDKETACLEESMKGLTQNRQGYYYAVLGLAALKMAARRSDEALALLQKLKEKNVEDMFFYLGNLAKAKEWDKLLVWLRCLSDEVKAASPVFLEGICEYSLLAAKSSPAGEEFIKLVKSWLPRSFDAYAGYLLEAGLFREWVELNISYPICDWQSLNKNALRQLESREPATLMPLYHQWSARLIEEKNRKSYREAVRLLKKLRGLYQRQKMGKEWSAFMARLASRYPRLRALQEELRKGKLIS